MYQNLVEKAKELINVGNLKQAESILLCLQDKYSVFELARIRKMQRRNKEAEQLYLKSLSMESEIKSYIDSDTNVELARIYADRGNVEKAKYRYLKGLDRISLEKNIYRELGELYSNIGDDKQAESNLEKAIKMFPNDVKTNLTLGSVYRRLGKEELAKKIFNKLLTEKEIKTSKFLYNKILNEYEILTKREFLESKPREIRNTITTKCNIACRYCDVWKDDGSWNQNESRTKEIVSLFPYMDHMYWLGGEIFYYKGYEDILEEGFKYDTLTQTIFTNGLMLNEKILNKISKSKVNLVIAIDAGKKETYEYLRRGSSWEKLCANLNLIKEMNHIGNKINTTFNAVISKSNYKEIYEMVEMAHKYDFDKIRFMFILGNSSENIYLNNDKQALEYIYNVMPFAKNRALEYGLKFESLLPSREKPHYKDINAKFVKDNNYGLIKQQEEKVIKCTAPWTQIVIDAKGPMRTCVNCNDWIGDSQNQTLSEFWNSESMQFFRRKFSQMYTCTGGYNLNGGPNDFANW